MRIKENQGQDEEQINLMPLIDMVFLLLIFFLVATTVAQEERELELDLPGLAAERAISEAPQQLIINVLEDGTVRVEGRTLDMDELRGRLARLLEEQSRREVLIRADERSMHRYFARVAGLCREVGVGKIEVGYIYDESP